MSHLIDTFLDQVRLKTDQLLTHLHHDAERPLSPAQQVALRAVFGATQRFCNMPQAKVIRPRVAAYFALAADAPLDKMVDVAVAAELIHAGSLLQDDVIDGATHRRGETTLRSTYGDRSAVLVGDLLMTVALQCLREHPPALILDALDAIAAMSTGALTEISCRGQLALGETTWRDIVEGKTGSLFAFCAKGAARLGNRENDLDVFTRTAMHLGVAFQLGDDLLDLWPVNSGKDPFADLRNHECTFPVIFATSTVPALREEVIRLWTQGKMTNAEVLNVGAKIRTLAAPEILRRIGSEIELALETFGPYRRTAGGEALGRWATSLLERASTVNRPEVRHAAIMIQ